MLEIVPVTAEHVEKIWGQTAPVTFQGIAVVDGERVMGVTGFYPDDAMPRLVLVARIAAEGYELLRSGRHGKVLMRAAREVMAQACSRKLPVHAVADPAIEGSVALLEHLGFKHFRKETYAWHGSQ